MLLSVCVGCYECVLVAMELEGVLEDGCGDDMVVVVVMWRLVGMLS